MPHQHVISQIQSTCTLERPNSGYRECNKGIFHSGPADAYSTWTRHGLRSDHRSRKWSYWLYVSQFSPILNLLKSVGSLQQALNKAHPLPDSVSPSPVKYLLPLPEKGGTMSLKCWKEGESGLSQQCHKCTQPRCRH